MASPPAERATVGLTQDGHSKLTQLIEAEIFPQMVDGYRFAAALALAHQVSAEPLVGARQTIFNVHTVDPERSLYLAVAAITEQEGETVYDQIERLAEWGVQEIYRRFETGTFDLAAVLKESVDLAGADRKL